MIARSLLLPIAMLCAAPAVAQCRLCAEPSAARAESDAAPVQLDVDSALDFDRLILTGSGPGTARIAPDGTRLASGAVVSIGGRAMAGTITVRGEPGRAIRVALPSTIRLFGLTGGEARIDEIRSDLPASPRIGSNGSLTIRFGGALTVDSTLDGDLRGDFTVDVDYL